MAKVSARISPSVLPAFDQRREMAKSDKERRKMKENEAKPIPQLPGWRDANPAPSRSASGGIQRKSVFWRFMWR
jgi:hypothetical protein